MRARLSYRSAAKAAGKSATLDRYAADYPMGPHDQPQSMCPAFGSLRVGLRMRRTATVLSGSACCVYGLTFTSHFYGARRSVGYVPFNSETLVTGKLFEDIREAVYKLADPAAYDAIVIINLCVPTASGVPLQLLPKEINRVRIIGIDVPGFGVPTHAEAKDVLAGAMLKYARMRSRAGTGAVAEGRAQRQTHRGLGGRNVSRGSGGHRHDARAVGVGGGARGAHPRVARALWCVGLRVGCCHTSFLYRIAARVHGGRAPHRRFGAGRVTTVRPRGLPRLPRRAECLRDKLGAAQNRVLPAIKAALAKSPIRGRITVSGYEGL